jgi:hypothetical protein
MVESDKCDGIAVGSPAGHPLRNPGDFARCGLRREMRTGAAESPGQLSGTDGRFRVRRGGRPQGSFPEKISRQRGHGGRGLQMRKMPGIVYDLETCAL